jgi:GTPase SAR1 family protein
MIIGLCGLAGSGKTTIAKYLVEKYGFIELSFATCLKDVVAHIFDWDRELIEGNTPESRQWRETIDNWWSIRLGIPNLTPRFILQYIGTDIMRNYFHPDIWISHLERKIQPNINYVITDCRFYNEISMLYRYNAYIIKVLKNNIKYDIHSSENLAHMTDDTTFNNYIKNDGTIEELYLEIDKLLKLMEV